MSTPTKLQERAALAALRTWQKEGVRAPELAPDVRRRLERERLIQPDEFGQHSITERGAERLQRLQRIFGRGRSAGKGRR